MGARSLCLAGIITSAAALILDAGALPADLVTDFRGSDGYDTPLRVVLACGAHVVLGRLLLEHLGSDLQFCDGFDFLEATLCVGPAVSAVKQELGEIFAVLTADAGCEGGFHA